VSGAQTRLIPANTTLLQPGSRFFRVVDALNYQAQSLLASNSQQSQTIANMQTQINTLNSQVATIQSQITALQNEDTNLQNQINTINTRLANAGIP